MDVAVIIGCLLLSAFFSGMETAYVSANKVYLGVEKKQTTLLSRVLTRLTENPVQFLVSMLIGNSIVLVIYGFYMAKAVQGWFFSAAAEGHIFYHSLLQIAIATFIILLTSEFMPKVFFQLYANTLIRIFALPAYGFYCLFFWVSKGVMGVSDFILIKVLGTKGDLKQAYFTRGELGNFISEQTNGVGEQEEVDSEIQIFKNALGFADLRARDIMTPRTEIAAIKTDDTIEELRQLFIATDYSKIVVYGDTLDDIVGYVHSFDLFKKPESVREIMIAIEYVPGTIYIKDLLNQLTRSRKSMAVVTDEYGGTAGIVTVEDIIEELFGEIEDEHDEEEELAEELLGEGAYLFSARHDVAYINEEYQLGLPESPSYTTLGGFIVHNTKEIPQTGEKLVIGSFSVFIEQSSGRKIELVKIEALRHK
jgi:CBS domain containing-hemolysin-like protein